MQRVVQPPSKREVMLALLERAEAGVHLDARRPGVILPPQLAGQGHVRLNYGYHFTPPIPDLTIDDAGVSATLSFGGRPFHTFVPWAAIYLIADFDGNGAVWQEDIPAELLERCGSIPAEASPDESFDESRAAPKGEQPRRPAFSVVPCSDEERGPEPPDGKPRGGHLKLVK